jgi:hypothetical protein
MQSLTRLRNAVAKPKPAVRVTFAFDSDKASVLQCLQLWAELIERRRAERSQGMEFSDEEVRSIQATILPSVNVKECDLFVCIAFHDKNSEWIFIRQECLEREEK